MVHPVSDQIIHIQSLNNYSLLHDGNAVTKMRDHRKVVADEHTGDRPLLPDGDQKIEDLGLDRGIERACGLIQKQDVGFERDCPGDSHSLPLPTGQLVRIPEPKSRPEPNLVKNIYYPAVHVGEPVQM